MGDRREKGEVHARPEWLSARLRERLSWPLLAAAGIALLVPTILIGSVELRMLLAASTLLVIGGLMVAMRRRISRLIDELDRAAGTDPLTGLLNRRRFDERFSHEIERQQRTGRALALVMLDLDRLKRVNDNHGHEAGDRALRELAAVLTNETRAIDVVARLGGDEFAVLAPETGPEGARTLAERLRTSVSDRFSERPVPLTVSCGVAIAPADGAGALELSRAADRALYRAKSLGRDLVALAHTPRNAPGEESRGGAGESEIRIVRSGAG